MAYANTEKKFSPVEFTSTRASNTATRVNASGNIEGVNADVPRIDYFGGQASLLVEPSGTNGIRNNSMVGAVVGSPGTLPTGGVWSTILRGLTQTIVGAGTENGIAYIDIRFSGTATSTNIVEIRYESNTQIVASSGQVWTNSIYLKKIADPNPPNDYQLSIYERDSGGGFLAFGFLTIVPTTTIQRFTQTRTLSGATTARVQPFLFFNVTNNQYYDFTIRIGYPQMELGSVATSVIPTTTGSVTRNADVISVTGVAGLIGQTEGTIYAEFFVDFNNRDADILSLDGGSTSDGFFMSIRSSSVVQLIVRTASANALIFQRAGAYPTGVNKLAVAYKNGDFAICLNGTTVQTDTSSITMPSVSINRAGLGQNRLYSLNQQLRIRAASIYQTRLPNTTTDGSPSLQSITTL